MAIDVYAGNASSLCFFPFLIRLQTLGRPRQVPPGSASLCRCIVGIPGSDSQAHFHSHHALGSVVATVATAVSATVVERRLGMVGMVGNESVMVRLLDQCSADGYQPFPFAISLLGSISFTRHLLLVPDAYIIPRLTLQRPCWISLPSLILHAGWPTLLASLPFLLTTNFSVTIRSPQTLARAPQCLALSTSRDAFPGRSHVVPALDESQHPSSALLPLSHLRDACSIWRQVADVAPHHSRRDLACAI